MVVAYNCFWGLRRASAIASGDAGGKSADGVSIVNSYNCVTVTKTLAALLRPHR